MGSISINLKNPDAWEGGRNARFIEDLAGRIGAADARSIADLAIKSKEGKVLLTQPAIQTLAVASRVNLAGGQVRQGEIGRCAAEHVSQDNHAFAAIAGLDRVADLSPALVNVIFGFDGN